MDDPGRPSHFCSRPDGSLAPLVAIDDLPAGVTVGNLPRKLSLDETEGMISCGVVPPRTEPWTVTGPADNAATATDDDVALLIAGLGEILVDANPKYEATRSVIASILFRGIKASDIDALRGLTAQGLINIHGGYYPKVDVGPAQKGKKNPNKIYCTYWIKNGACDYTQQGCMYKHEMPPSFAALRDIGILDIPHWYLQQYGVPTFWTDYGIGKGKSPVRNRTASPESDQYHSVATGEGIAGPSGSNNGNGYAGDKVSGGRRGRGYNKVQANNNGQGKFHASGHLQDTNNGYETPVLNATKRSESTWRTNTPRQAVTPTVNEAAPYVAPVRHADKAATPIVNEAAGYIVPIYRADTSKISPQTKNLLLVDSVVPSADDLKNLAKNGMTRGDLVAQANILGFCKASDPFLDGVPDQFPSRTKSRFFFGAGADGGLKNAIPKLTGTSIGPDEDLIDFGPIVEPVRRASVN